MGALQVRFWGDLACFTRPETKVERVSYPVVTPSAARGMLEAILWKPEFHWEVREIHVLRPPRFISLVRNEVSSRASPERAGAGFYADDDRAQRHTLALRDVAYVVVADMVLNRHASNEHPAKYRDQFLRHVQRGQCYYQPYLGCREFSAGFGATSPSDCATSWTQDLGLMLFDLDYGGGEAVAQPIFFNAFVRDGVLKIPKELYERGGNGNAPPAAS